MTTPMHCVHRVAAAYCTRCENDELRAELARLRARLDAMPPMLLCNVSWHETQLWAIHCGGDAWYHINEHGACLVRADEITEVDESLSDPRAVELWKAEREPTINPAGN